jgi:predicted kinase
MIECVILVGLPAAGKTTFYKQRFSETHRHVSKDLSPRVGDQEQRQQWSLVDAFRAGDSVVVDNTNASRRERHAIIASAKAHHARVIGYVFKVSTREAVARNRERAGREKVPNVAIFTVAKRFESPTLDEGFDRLYRVALDANRRFTIEEIKN